MLTLARSAETLGVMASVDQLLNTLPLGCVENERSAGASPAFPSQGASPKARKGFRGSGNPISKPRVKTLSKRGIMAKLVIPNDGNESPTIRNFDEYVVFDPSGRTEYRRKVAGTWVLTRSGDVRQLVHYFGLRASLERASFWTLFWLLLGVWITLVIQRFS